MATSSQAQAIPGVGEVSAGMGRARRGLAIFFTVLIPLTALFEVLVARTGDMKWYLPLMWTPTLVAIVARLALHEGIDDVSFRAGHRRGWQAVLAALLFPTVVGLGAYGSAWALA